MTNRTIAFSVLTFAVVASLLTMYRKSQMMTYDVPVAEPAVQVSPMMQEKLSITGYDNEYSRGTSGMGAGMGMSGRMDSVPIGTVAPPVLYEEGKRIAQDIMIMPPVPTMYPDDALDVVERVYDKSASHGVVVNDVDDFAKQITSYISSVGGKVLSFNQNTSDGMDFAFINAQVPSEKFDDVNNMVTVKSKKVANKSIDVSDVTGKQVAIESRLQNLIEEKANKATQLSAAPTDAEKKRIQAQIDELDRQIKYQTKNKEQLTQEVRYSTIIITAANTERYFNPQKGGSLLEELRRAIASMGGTSRVLASFVVWVLVYSVIWVPIILAIRWLWQFTAPTKSTK